MDLVYLFVPILFRISKMVLVCYNTFFSSWFRWLCRLMSSGQAMKCGVSHPKIVQHLVQGAWGHAPSNDSIFFSDE